MKVEAFAFWLLSMFRSGGDFHPDWFPAIGGDTSRLYAPGQETGARQANGIKIEVVGFLTE